MNEDSSLKNIIKNIPSARPNKDFVENLQAELANRSENLYKSKTNSEGAFSFWQISLALTSLSLIAVIMFTVAYSPSTMNTITNYLDQDAKSALSDQVTVVIRHVDPKVSELFVYDLIIENSPPIVIKHIQYSPDDSDKDQSSGLQFELYPGQYRIVVVEGEETVFEENVLISTKSEETVVLN